MSKQQHTTLMRYHPNTGTSWVTGMSADAYRAQYPGTPWGYNPWTGKRRHMSDIESDPQGRLIVPPGEQIIAARPEPYTDTSPADHVPIRTPENTEPEYQEPYIRGAVYLCDIPAGAQLIVVDGKVIVVAPPHAPCFVTPTGLKPIPVAPPKTV